MSPETLRHELFCARSLLQSDQDLSIPLSIGVGFLGWTLELPDSQDVELLTIALENHVKAVWFAFGDHTNRWLQLVRDHDQRSGANRKTLVFVQISSVDEAEVAIRDWRVDVIVAQGSVCPSLGRTEFSSDVVLFPGNEAGGHGRSSAPPLLTLVPSIVSVLPKPGPILLAAGGLSHGAHVAAMLTLGVSGVVLGTRFLLTPESLYSDVQKKALINASSTVRTMAFDYVRNTLGWPSGVDGRALHNLTVEEFDKGVSLDQVKNRYSSEDPSRVVVWSGTGVALMSVIKPAKVCDRKAPY